MQDSLDMSTASIISPASSTAFDSDPPSLPNSVIESPPLSRKEQLKLGKTPPSLQPLPILDEQQSYDKAPSTWAFMKGHARYFAKTSVQFIFKDNNLPLLINVIYHLLAARALVVKPLKTVERYINIPPILPTASNPLRYQIEQTAAIAKDSFRALGVLHLALGFLSLLALKERRQSSERSALLVLTLSSIGQTWAHFNAYWKNSGSRYTYKALQEIGASNIIVTTISAIALSKTVRRTGRIV
ncbi:unnamed protein product [Mucor hiemalis]